MHAKKLFRTKWMFWMFFYWKYLFVRYLGFIFALSYKIVFLNIRDPCTEDSIFLIQALLHLLF